MDELEFRQRVYANPDSVDQELLDAARDNPAYQKILDQTRQLEGEVSTLLNSTPIPEGLKDKLMAIPATAGSSELLDQPAANNSFFHYYAIAASLLLAVGVTFSLTFNSGPSSAEVVFGNEVLEHLYLETAEIGAVNSGSANSIVSMPIISEAMANAGTRLVSNEFMQDTPVRFAKPCIILPAYQSAHLIIEGSQGAVSVIVINNSPVSVEYTIRDDRFVGVVVPMRGGNIILVGEKDADLGQYKNLFSENVDFVI